MPIVNGSGNASGGSSPSTATADLSTDPNTYDYSHVFDLGHATVATITAELIAFTGDGETLGSAPGDIQISVAGDTSADNSVFAASVLIATGDALYPDKTLVALTTPGEIALTTARYLRVQGDWEDSGFNSYAGPNNPFGTVRITIEYV